jgi:hypothetical protein
MLWTIAPLIQGSWTPQGIHLALSLAGFSLWSSVGLLLCFAIFENVCIVMGWRSGTRKKKPTSIPSFLSIPPTSYEVLPALECRVDAAPKERSCGVRGTDLFI